MTDKEMGGIEMGKISATFRILLRKRQVDSIIPLLSRCNLCMIMMKYIWLIAILTPILIVQNY